MQTWSHYKDHMETSNHGASASGNDGRNDNQNPSDGGDGGKTGMQIDIRNGPDGNNASNDVFRTKSLVLVTFPWCSNLPMYGNNLASFFEAHDGCENVHRSFNISKCSKEDKIKHFFFSFSSLTEYSF